VGWTIGVLGFDSRRGLGIFLFTIASRTALGPTQPPTQWVPGAFSLGVKRPGREADHSPPSSAEVKNAWSYTSAPQYAFMALWLVKHRENFTFTYPEGRRPVGRFRGGWKDNIKMDPKVVLREGVDWLHLAQDSDQWRGLFKILMNCRVP
jgi:hypothetical protein